MGHSAVGGAGCGVCLFGLEEFIESFFDGSQISFAALPQLLEQVVVRVGEGAGPQSCPFDATGHDALEGRQVRWFDENGFRGTTGGKGDVFVGGRDDAGPRFDDRAEAAPAQRISFVEEQQVLPLGRPRLVSAGIRPPVDGVVTMSELGEQMGGLAHTGGADELNHSACCYGDGFCLGQGDAVLEGEFSKRIAPEVERCKCQQGRFDGGPGDGCVGAGHEPEAGQSMVGRVDGSGVTPSIRLSDQSGQLSISTSNLIDHSTWLSLAAKVGGAGFGTTNCH